MGVLAITGGAGFIGQYIVKGIAECYKDLRVRVLDNFSDQVHDDYAEEMFRERFPQVELRVGSVTNPDDVEWLLDGASSLIHLASETGTGQSMYDLRRYTEVNLSGTATIIEYLLKRKVKLDQIILTSSRSVYGEGQYAACMSAMCGADGNRLSRNVSDLQAGRFDVLCPSCHVPLKEVATSESCATEPLSYYALTKLAQEQQFELYKGLLCQTLTIFRLQNVYGPGQSLTNPYTGILAIFSSLAKEGVRINVFEDGNETRDFVHVTDVVTCVIGALVSGRKRDFDTTLNVGSGVPTKVKDVADSINEYFGGRSSVQVTGDFRVGDIRHNFADVSKLAATGISPSGFIKFSDGIMEFLSSTGNKTYDMNARLRRSLDELADAGMFVERKNIS